jgi:2,4-dienoyl-CoA reductase-like NADH-dependent reductase (Old Yellow Enzyme family)
MPAGMPLLVKYNGNDHTPQEGVTPLLAARYARWLAELGINALEVSCGTTSYSPWNLVRGQVPVDELLDAWPVEWRPAVRPILEADIGKYNLEEGYNLEAAKAIRPAAGNVPLFLVGGMRRVSHMEQVLESGYADGISMSRPFIREPHLVKQIREGKTEVAACEACNRCVAAEVVGIPVRCYASGWPQ